MTKSATKILPYNVAVIAAAKARDGKQIEFSIAGVRGLKLVVLPSGIATFMFSYAIGEGRHRTRNKIKIARRDAITLADARKRADELRRKIEAGIDPAREFEVRHDALTFQELAEKRLAEDQGLAETTRAGYAHMLKSNVYPAIGRKLACEVKPEDVAAVINTIEDRGSARHADHTKATISATYSWAKRRWPALYPVNPAAGLGRRGDNVPRTRILTVVEIKAFWAALDNADAPISPKMRVLFKLALLLGKRRSEIAGIRTAELNLDAVPPTWTIPGDEKKMGRLVHGRSKSGQTQVAYLSRQVLDLLKTAQSMAGENPVYLFPAEAPKYHDPNGSQKMRLPHLHPESVSLAMRRLRAYAGIEDATTHDLRRTMATWFGEQAMHPTVIEITLGHVGSGVTRRYYNHASLSNLVAQAWQSWADYVWSITGQASLNEVSPVPSHDAARDII
jgi:integrase